MQWVVKRRRNTDKGLLESQLDVEARMNGTRKLPCQLAVFFPK
jgi:hypothetical protein